MTTKNQSKPGLKPEIERRIADKWRDWSGISDMDPEAWDELSDRETDELKALVDSERKIEQDAAQMAELVRLPQWALMEEFRANLIEVLRSTLEKLDPQNDAAAIRNIQAELRVLRKYENFVLSKISAI